MYALKAWYFIWTDKCFLLRYISEMTSSMYCCELWGNLLKRYLTAVKERLATQIITLTTETDFVYSLFLRDVDQ